MIPPDLPAALKAVLEAKLYGQSRQDAGQRATRISQTYRSGGGSVVITTEVDALAYALVRMPATYAAVAASLNALAEIRPDFAPTSLLDVGAGPGTASFAATASYPSLTSITALDSNPALRTLALALATEAGRLGALDYTLGNARALIDQTEPADLVIASYVINELSDKERAALIARMWAKTRDTLLIVEPGTPTGYTRIIAARTQLIAAGAHLAAPCPHDQACPLIAPDWCHFAQRLARSRAHKQIKDAELPFEDEKFIYLVLTKQPLARRPQARVLAPPVVTKVAATTKLCCADGLMRIRATPRRDKAAFAAARRWDWGDGVDNEI